MAVTTPVSALIHAATMVTSGIYQITRMSPLYVMTPEVMLIVAVIGALTAIVAATIAITKYDIKGVLAYSTVSQRPEEHTSELQSRGHLVCRLLLDEHK